VTLWEIDIHPAEGMPDAEGRRIAADAGDLGLPGNLTIRAAHGYLLQGDLQREQIERLAAELFSDSVVERTVVAPIGDALLNQSPEAAEGEAVKNGDWLRAETATTLKISSREGACPNFLTASDSRC
jgi:phosphoribosylformylglycinamidine synthase subunit PurSL